MAEKTRFAAGTIPSGTGTIQARGIRRPMRLDVQTGAPGSSASGGPIDRSAGGPERVYRGPSGGWTGRIGVPGAAGSSAIAAPKPIAAAAPKPVPSAPQASQAPRDAPAISAPPAPDSGLAGLKKIAAEPVAISGPAEQMAMAPPPTPMFAPETGPGVLSGTIGMLRQGLGIRTPSLQSLTLAGLRRIY